jgi:HEAT repeat protein
MSEEFANASARGRAPDATPATLCDRLDAGTVRERRDAVLGLLDAVEDGHAPSDRTIATLAERAMGDPDPDTRQFAVETLGVAGTGEQAIRSALADRNEWVRAEAVVALSRTAGADAADRLRATLADEAGAVRRNALIALAKLGAVDPERLRSRLREDEHSPVREYAAKWLGTHPGETEETVTLLAAVLARDPEAFVRANAARSLGELGTDRAIEALEAQGVEDRSNDVQRAAKRALAAARGEDPDSVDLDDAPAPGGGPSTPERGPGGPPPGGHGPEPTGGQPPGARGNATRKTGRDSSGRPPRGGDPR